MQGNGCKMGTITRQKISTSRKLPLPLDLREGVEVLKPRGWRQNQRAVQWGLEPWENGSCCQRDFRS